jgi:hypothetical protein
VKNGAGQLRAAKVEGEDCGCGFAFHVAACWGVGREK